MDWIDEIKTKQLYKVGPKYYNIVFPYALILGGLLGIHRFYLPGFRLKLPGIFYLILLYLILDWMCVTDLCFFIVYCVLAIYEILTLPKLISKCNEELLFSEGDESEDDDKQEFWAFGVIMALLITLPELFVMLLDKVWIFIENCCK